MKKELMIDFNIKVAYHTILKMYNFWGKNFGINSTTGYILLNIDLKKGSSATEIGYLIGLDFKSPTRILKKMERDSWVIRKKDAFDGRLSRFFLTPIGEEKREIARKSVLAFNKQILQKISKEELESFFKVIDKVFGLVMNKEEINNFLKTI